MCLSPFDMLQGFVDAKLLSLCHPLLCSSFGAQAVSQEEVIVRQENSSASFGNSLTSNVDLLPLKDHMNLLIFNHQKR